MDATVDMTERRLPAAPMAVPISFWFGMTSEQIGRTSASFQPTKKTPVKTKPIARDGVSMSESPITERILSATTTRGLRKVHTAEE